MKLVHGTTAERAESILKNGPDPAFKEPKSIGHDPAGFSAALADWPGPWLFGSPIDIAYGKASGFPDEGGPAILEFEVPDDILAKADVVISEVRFDADFGIQELLDEWPLLTKHIRLLPPGR